MKKISGALALLCVMAACSGGREQTPGNLDDACVIVSQNPGWLRDMQRAERKWGVPAHVQMATIYQESKFIGDARTPFRYTLGVIPMGRQSSAYGYSQALDATWKEYKEDQGRHRAKRDSFGDSVDFMGWYMHNSHLKLGIAKTDTRNQYLAYHQGRAGYARGSYHGKTWLLRVSGEVAQRANLYQRQLHRCGK